LQTNGSVFVQAVYMKITQLHWQQQTTPAHRPAREIDHVAQDPPRTHRSGDTRRRHATRNASLGLGLASLALFLALWLAPAFWLAPELRLASALRLVSSLARASRLTTDRGSVAPAE